MERARRTARENVELGVRQSKLLQEIEELRAENDALLAARQQLLVANAAAASEATARAKLVETERESQGRRASHLQQELDSAFSGAPR